MAYCSPWLAIVLHLMNRGLEYGSGLPAGPVLRADLLSSMASLPAGAATACPRGTRAGARPTALSAFVVLFGSAVQGGGLDELGGEYLPARVRVDGGGL